MALDRLILDYCWDRVYLMRGRSVVLNFLVIQNGFWNGAIWDLFIREMLSEEPESTVWCLLCSEEFEFKESSSAASSIYSKLFGSC
jgi:hypothetical protein